MRSLCKLPVGGGQEVSRNIGVTLPRGYSLIGQKMPEVGFGGKSEARLRTHPRSVSEPGNHPHLFMRVAALVSTCVFEFGVFAAHLDSHGCGLAVPIPPEPSVFAVKCRDDLALVAGGAAALLIGHRLTAAVALPLNRLCLNLCGGTVAFSPATILDRLDRTWRV